MIACISSFFFFGVVFFQFDLFAESPMSESLQHVHVVLGMSKLVGVHSGILLSEPWRSALSLTLHE